MTIARFLAALLLFSSACAQPVRALPVDGGQPPSDFCDDYVQAFCDWSIRCGQTSSLYRRECEALARTTCAPTGRRTVDPLKATACLQRLAGSCQAVAPSGACIAMFHGAVTTGGSCQAPEDCQSAADSCGGLGCRKVCMAAGGLSQPCRQDQQCAQGLRCDWPTKICQLPKVPGGPGTTCESGPPDCDDTAFCDFRIYKCAALPVAGEACRTIEPKCTGASWCRGNTCEAKLAEAASCLGTDSCQSGLFCDATCQAKRAAGALCSRADQCLGDLRCIEGACAVPLAAGGSCRSSEQCGAGLSCDRVTRTCAQLAFTTTAGGPCTGDRVYCGSGLRCEGALENPSGVAGTVGSCRPTGYCACKSNEWCNTHSDGTFTCDPRKVDGQPCDDRSQCVNICVPRKAASPTCGKLGELGESCGFSKSLEQSCVFPLQCEGQGTCQHAGDEGESCVGGGLCFSGGCSRQGLCGATLLEGSDCWSGSACQSGVCLSGKCTALCD